MNMYQKQAGASALLVPLVLTGVLFLVSLGFGIWAFAGMLDYKNHSDTKVAAAVVVAKQQEDKVKDAAFVEAEKQPLRSYVGPAAYGTVTVKYPKTWSAYISDSRNGSPYIDGYWYPNYVPDTQASDSVYALRVQVVQDSYANELSQFTSMVRDGTAKAAPYHAPQVPSVIGTRIDGKLPNNKIGTMILLPLRNNTLKLWTEAPQFEQDFGSNVLAYLTFVP